MHDKFDNNNDKIDSGFPYHGKFFGKFRKMEIFRLENYRFYISGFLHARKLSNLNSPSVFHKKQLFYFSKLSHVYHCNGCDSFVLHPLGLEKPNEKNVKLVKYCLPVGPPVSTKCQNCGGSFHVSLDAFKTSAMRLTE